MRTEAERLARALKAAGYTAACAESCTGGLVAAAMTSLPGASAYFLGGVVAYANAAKEAVLGVPSSTLESCGAVSGPTALAMASGAARLFGADCAVSVTGIAGPDGGSPDKPVGTVWFGFSLLGSVSAESAVFQGDRAMIRDSAVSYALEGLALRVDTP